MRRLKVFLSTIVCYVLLLLPLSVQASTFSQEAEYTITASELTLLDTRLEQLSASNSKLAEDCRMLKAQLVQSQEALNEAKLQVEQLQAQLTALKQQSNNNEATLKSAEESLNAYAKEVKKQQQTIKRQYTLAGILLGVVVCVAAT